MYKLIAHNSQGASIDFNGKTKKECLDTFLSIYNRKGWKIKYIKIPAEDNLGERA
jgi:hypothetical protein